MLESGRYSDLTIKCGGKVFKVHRNVVCLQSRPLAAHVDSKFIVSAFTFPSKRLLILI